MLFTKRFRPLIPQRSVNDDGGLVVQLFVSFVIIELLPIRLLFTALNNAIRTLQAELRPVHPLYTVTLRAACALSKRRIQLNFILAFRALPLNLALSVI